MLHPRGGRPCHLRPAAARIGLHPVHAVRQEAAVGRLPAGHPQLFRLFRVAGDRRANCRFRHATSLPLPGDLG
jgi:hypothetical protein